MKANNSEQSWYKLSVKLPDGTTRIENILATSFYHAVNSIKQQLGDYSTRVFPVTKVVRKSK